MDASTWWHGRIVAGLASSWVYQHLGNLSPTERVADEIWKLVAAHESGSAADAPTAVTGARPELDLTDVLDAFAARCDRNPCTYRWSYCRDFTDTRLIVLDSRTTRVLEPSRRALLDEGERTRRALDLEHWGAFQRSFHDVAAMATELADGRRGPAPETVMFLSGDVHYSYVEQVDRSSGGRIVQAVCSPRR